MESIALAGILYVGLAAVVGAVLSRRWCPSWVRIIIGTFMALGTIGLLLQVANRQPMRVTVGDALDLLLPVSLLAATILAHFSWNRRAASRVSPPPGAGGNQQSKSIPPHNHSETTGVTAADVEHVQEKVLASTLLFETTGKSSAIMDKFSGWLLVGYAAAVTFLITNSASLSDILSPELLRSTIRWLFVVVLLAVAEKFLAMILAASSSGASLGRKYVSELVDRGIEIDPKVVFREMERAMIPPIRWIVARSYRKAQSGDLTAAARNMSRCGQVQAFLVLAQAAVILYAIAAIARNADF